MRMAMMAMTTSSSISVKAERRDRDDGMGVVPSLARPKGRAPAGGGRERPLPDSNRGWRICNPLPYRLAKGPDRRPITGVYRSRQRRAGQSRPPNNRHDPPGRPARTTQTDAEVA